MHYPNKQPLIFAPLNASSLLLLMGCVVIRNNSQTPIEFDAETASYIKDENIGLRAGEIVHTPTLQIQIQDCKICFLLILRREWLLRRVISHLITMRVIENLKLLLSLQMISKMHDKQSL